MVEAAPERYQFGSFLLDLSEQRLSAHGNIVPLRPTTFRMLAWLVRHHGHLIGKEELLKAVWPNSFVE